MGRAAKWIGGILAVLALLCAILILVVYFFDWNRVKPRISQQVTAATGRHFDIGGKLAVDWRRDAQAHESWKKFVPLPVLQAEDVVLGNPEWAEHDNMASVKKLSLGIELLPLLERKVVLRDLSLQGAVVALEREQERNSWTFERPADSADDSGEPWQLAVSELRLSEGQLAWRDAPLQLAIDATVQSLEAPENAPGADAPGVATPGADASGAGAPGTDASGAGAPYFMAFSFTGTYREAKLEGEGKTGAMLSLRDPDVRFPVFLDARSGDVAARAEGVVGNLQGHPELDLQVRLSAPSMAMLYPVTGVVLPNTPPFASSGRLHGSLAAHGQVWRYQDFTGSVGKSDLQGSLEYERPEQGRPSLSGELKSKLLQFADLGPLIGAGKTPADPAAPEAAARESRPRSNRRPDRVLPDNAFITDRWQAMDLDLRFSGDHIVRDAALPLENLRTHAIMKDSVLELSPLAFGVAEGTLEADIRLDGSRKPMRARLTASLRDVQLPALFPTVEAMRQAAGRIDGAIAMSARGNSIAELLGAGEGELKVYLQSGRISKFLLEAASLNVASAVVAKLFGDSEVRIRCAGVSMAMKDGLATMRDFRISTEDALIDVTGAVDFADERLSLDVKPESRGLRIFSLRTPLYVDGTFSDPDIGLEKGPLLARAGAAIGLIAAAPAAVALLPLTVPGADTQTDCDELLAAAHSKPSMRPDTSSPIDERSPEQKSDAGKTQTKPAATPPAPAAKPGRDADTEVFGNGATGPSSTIRAH